MADLTNAERMTALSRKAELVRNAIDAFPGIVETYLTLTGAPATVFGKASGGGIDFVRHMREPRDLRRSTLVRVLRHIEVAGKRVEPTA